MNLERRALTAPLELRASEGGGVTVVGYAAVFNERANIAGLFEEVIAPGAFRSALTRRDDVVLLVNHGGLPLARTKSGTLKLEEDKRGLRIEAELDPADPDVARVIPKMRRNDLNEMSFAFEVPQGGQTWDESGSGLAVRTVTDVILHDVAIVNTGAYSGTEVALRALGDTRDAKKEVGKRNSDAAQRRIATRKAETEMRLRGISPATK